MIASGRPALPPSASRSPRPPWGEAAGTTLRRMFSREPRGPPIPASVRLHVGPLPGIEARSWGLRRGRGPRHDSAEGGRFGGVYCRLAPSRQDSRVPPVPPAPWCRLVTSVDPGGPRQVTCPRRAGSGEGLNGRLWGPALSTTLKTALSPPARRLPKTFKGTGRTFQQKSWGRPRLRCGENAGVCEPQGASLSPRSSHLPGGGPSQLRDEGRASDGLEEHAPGCTKPGSAAAAWHLSQMWLPFVSDQLPRLARGPRGLRGGEARPSAPRHLSHVQVCLRPNPASGAQETTCGQYPQSSSQAYGLGAACGPQPSSFRRLLLMPGPGQRKRPPWLPAIIRRWLPGAHFLTTELGKS